MACVSRTYPSHPNLNSELHQLTLCSNSLIIAISFRLANFNSSGLTTNPTFLQDKFIIWTQTELCYSIIAAIIPSIRPFIKQLATNYGAGPEGSSGYGNGYADGYANAGADPTLRSGGYEMSSLRPKGDGDEYNYRIWSGGKDGAQERQ